MCHTAERRGRTETCGMEKKIFLSKRTFICQRCASCRVFKHESRFDAEAEGDGNSAQLETEPCCKQKVRAQPQSCLKALCCVSVPPVCVQLCGFKTVA